MSDAESTTEEPGKIVCDMGLRITTWNVNGIRNPFAYQPWREKKTFAAMFDILEADIVVFQETKIQRKDLKDDMVLVPGWDCYFSLPKHKKGYSGVVIYTRQAVCCPVRAEEGITGILCPPNSSTSYSNLPKDKQVGGYPTASQVAHAAEISSLVSDFAILDSEGRCVILEFPAFVLIGVYSPANRDETRDDFRLGFLSLLDSRVRNLVSIGKRVVLAGDLNISKEELDTANSESAMRKSNMTAVEYFSTPARRIFNQLLEDGNVYGPRDSNREHPVLWDICRGFHPFRKGMFTCWETKVNARPGNFGARIDYVLCSLDMKAWFCDSNIQEGLLGSDHCPVYATINDNVPVNTIMVDIRDIVNPRGTFHNGRRLRNTSTDDLLPLSGKLIKEFDGRQSIRDMFTRKSTLPKDATRDTSVRVSPTTSDNVSSESTLQVSDGSTLYFDSSLITDTTQALEQRKPREVNQNSSVTSASHKKRVLSEMTGKRHLKRAKSVSTGPPSTTASKGQQSLRGFFVPKTLAIDDETTSTEINSFRISSVTNPTNPVSEASQGILSARRDRQSQKVVVDSASTTIPDTYGIESGIPGISAQANPGSEPGRDSGSSSDVHDPIESKESWSKLFTKPAAPRCESHDEPCISLLTKKPGINCGRSFWMCGRPLGPTGAKERNTQWRCQTFIWCSDWASLNGA